MRLSSVGGELLQEGAELVPQPFAGQPEGNGGLQKPRFRTAVEPLPGKSQSVYRATFADFLGNGVS